MTAAQEPTSALLAEIADTGRDQHRGGYSRHLFTDAELGLREWFTEAATRRGLTVEVDRNSNLWAWWGEPGPGAVVTGSHLDSVPGGGAYDGPLGVASALAAVDLLKAEDFRPTKPFALAVFAEEEGGRFGRACLGSALSTGTVDAADALRRTDPDGVTLAEAAKRAGFDPSSFGADKDRIANIGTFVELHIEQGRYLADLAPVAVASAILAHGRWRFRFAGQGNHAGTTRLEDRADPMMPAAATVIAARQAAAKHDARATVGRLQSLPGGTNVIASTVDLWLDARDDRDEVVTRLVEDITRAAESACRDEGCQLTVTRESFAPEVTFDTTLARQLAKITGDAPIIPTGAGHDAGILAAATRTGMLFVRNPTGISHAPEEHAEKPDIEIGTKALAAVVRDLAR
ncbi:allantoate amidohydrolase [Fodinicola acaciae]|uniref:allantoate amidohydrolase n=1 Tax=Fodinicola acaciae TaxID=2681555 RepID=UPI0013CF4417|nr:allantoate amidohydrolase [Fodinicola acaciae]